MQTETTIDSSTGAVTLWDVHQQTWRTIPAHRVGDQVLATLSDAEREAIAAACPVSRRAEEAAHDEVESRAAFFVVAAPGHYGDRTVVVSSHRTMEAARRNAGTGYVVRVGDMRKGDSFLRAYEQTYPLAN